jgi:tetratricopeptide (TPR) repeat protein
MGFVPIRCSGCGASVELDDSKEIGFCIYCGTKMYLDTPKVKADGFPSVENLLLRATQYEAAGDWNKAKEYYYKALDLDPYNKTAAARLSLKFKLSFQRKRQFNTWGEPINVEIQSSKESQAFSIGNGDAGACSVSPGGCTVTLIHPFLNQRWKLKFEVEVSHDIHFDIWWSRLNNYPVAQTDSVSLLNCRNELG